MPPKRRLSGAEGEEEEPGGGAGSASTTPEPGRKRKKLDPLEQMKAVLEFVRKYKKEDGAELCGAMTRLPNKRSEPGELFKSRLYGSRRGCSLIWIRLTINPV
jgi:hypothetical protein